MMNPLPHNPDLQQIQIEEFANMINSSHKPVQFEGLIGLRRNISVDENRKSFSTYLIPNNPIQAPIQKVIDSGIVPKLLEIMTCEDNPQFQIESSWIVLNLCSGEDKFVDYILDLGGLDILINLLDSKDDEVVSNAIFSIRNIAGTGSKYRDLCLQKDCMKKFLDILHKGEIQRNVLDEIFFAISNLCEVRPYPNWGKILPALPLLQNQIANRYSEIAFNQALWALSAISHENIQEVIDEDCVPFLVKHLCDNDPEILAPALKTLSHLLTGTDRQADRVLDYEEFLPRIFQLTKSPKKIFRKEALWVISNIAAGTSRQIEMILENDYILKLKIALFEEEKEVAEHAAWTICNMISGGDEDQIDRIVKKHGFMESFAYILREFTGALQKEVLGVLLTVLKIRHWSPDTKYPEHMKEAGLVEIVQELANDSDFTEDAEKILDYF